MVKVVVQLEDGAGVSVRAPEKVRAPACTPGFFDGGRPRLQPQIRPRTSRAKSCRLNVCFYKSVKSVKSRASVDLVL